MVILQQKQVFSETAVYIWMICHTVLDNHFVQGTTRADFSFHPRLISNLLISAKIRGLNEICVQFLSTKPNWKNRFVVPCGQVIRSQNWKQIRKILFHCRENLLLLLGIFVLISRLLISHVQKFKLDHTIPLRNRSSKTVWQIMQIHIVVSEKKFGCTTRIANGSATLSRRRSQGQTFC